MGGKGWDKNFNSHAHVERDSSLRGRCKSQDYFNSHAHVERDTIPFPFHIIIQYFNSHAHVERDNNTFSILKQFKISTHTLTWSVTKKSRGDKMFIAFQLTRSRGAWHYVIVSIKKWYIFQLTRSRGAWPKSQEVIKCSLHFNSHAHVERDIMW